MIPIIKGTAPKSLGYGEVHCQLSILSSREGKFRVRCVFDRHIPGNPAGVGFGLPRQEEVEDLAQWVTDSLRDAQAQGAKRAYLDFPESDPAILAIVKDLPQAATSDIRTDSNQGTEMKIGGPKTKLCPACHGKQKIPIERDLVGSRSVDRGQMTCLVCDGSGHVDSTYPEEPE